jgi:hypothetical protein
MNLRIKIQTTLCLLASKIINRYVYYQEKRNVNKKYVYVKCWKRKGKNETQALLKMAWVSNLYEKIFIYFFYIILHTFLVDFVFFPLVKILL